MKKLTSRVEVIDMLENLLAVEKSARDRYEEEVLSFNDADLKEKINSIKKDEDRHIAMIEELIGKIKR